ncbi:MAG: sulfite exporter TauE/SafE family protein [Clostridia bacterium]|nr:sulfite exporter TauE/SafE family protein [Clostridia bacterium]
MIKRKFKAEGTTCESCEKIIIKQAQKIKGVKQITFNYSKEEGEVTFDNTKTNLDEILYKIEEKKYTCYIIEDSNKKTKISKAGWIFLIIGLLIAIYFLFHFIEGIQMPSISQNMSLGLLFFVGILTGFHCISMCGGFVISYTAKDVKNGKKPHNSHLMYGLGKTISYTIIGALFGLLGSFIAFTPSMRGLIGLLAGLFLILFGLKMLNVFPTLRKIQFKTPKIISKFIGTNSNKSNSPLIIGLLNGLMIACGPLQAIYIMAAGTGSMLEGAKLLLVFGLGTLPVMIGFGYFASFVSSKVTQKILKLSGIVVIILGVIMLNNGLILTGSGYDIGAIVSSNNITKVNTIEDPNSPQITLKDGFQEIRMDVTNNGFEPNKFILKKGIPVKWIINGKELNGCNNAIQVPSYNLAFDVKPGEQTIEFTPTEAGTIRWSCWMGMIPGTFIVK